MKEEKLHNDEQHRLKSNLPNKSDSFIKTFSSQDEADTYRLKKNMEMSDMEKFQKFCRMMRIGKMLSSKNISLK